jgi:hypothetical protein
MYPVTTTVIDQHRPNAHQLVFYLLANLNLVGVQIILVG